MFVDGILSTLSHEFPTINSPRPGSWKLTRNDNEEDLGKWNPYHLDPNTPIFVSSNAENHLAPITSTFASRPASSWTWAPETKAFKLLTRDVFTLDGDSHLQLVLRCQTKAKISKKQRRIDETIHSVLVPADYRVADVLRAMRTSAVNGVFEEPHADDLRLDHRSASELGWKHGTTLRLELW